MVELAGLSPDSEGLRLRFPFPWDCPEISDIRITDVTCEEVLQH